MPPTKSKRKNPATPLASTETAEGTTTFDVRAAIDRAEFLWRRRMIAVIAPSAIGTLLLLARLVADEETLFRLNRVVGPFSFAYVVAATFGVTGLALMFLYLQTGLSRARFVDGFVERAERYWRGAHRNTRTGVPNAHAPRLPTEPAEPATQPPPQPKVERDVGEQRVPRSGGEDPQVPLIASVVAQVGDQIMMQVLSEFEERLSRDAQRNERLSMTLRETTDVIDRLKEESRRLGFRGNLNLVIGITITAVGVYAMLYFVNSMPAITFDQHSGWRLAERIVPRLSLVILIEIFAYFFLRLYKESLSDIKYYQNELTNAQSRRLAILLSASAPAADELREVILLLARTERNVVLRKDETTPDIKRSESERGTTITILKEIASIVSGSGGKAVKAPASDNEGA